MDSRMLVLVGIACAISVATLLVSVLGPKSAVTKKVDKSFDRQSVAYGTSLKSLSTALGTFLPLAILYLYLDGRFEFSVALAALCVAAIAFGYCAPEFHRTRIEFDTKFVYAYSAWRKPRVIPWTIIMDYKHSPLKHWYVFDTFGHGSLRVSQWMRGADTFLAKFNECGEAALEYSASHSAASHAN